MTLGSLIQVSRAVGTGEVCAKRAPKAAAYPRCVDEKCGKTATTRTLAKRKGTGFSAKLVDAMEAVRLSFPRDVMHLIRAFASDKIGVHPAAELWDMEVDRVEAYCGSGRRIVAWRLVNEIGRVRVVYWSEP